MDIILSWLLKQEGTEQSLLKEKTSCDPILAPSLFFRKRKARSQPCLYLTKGREGGSKNSLEVAGGFNCLLIHHPSPAPELKGSSQHSLH